MSTTSPPDLTRDYVTSAGAIGGPLDVSQAFLSALARREFAELADCFASEALFRALVPSGVREGTGRQEAVAWLRRWFGSAELFELQRAALDRVADRLCISYRILVRKEGVLYLIEQQAYCVVANGQLSAMNLVCSGFRPLEALAQ